MIGRIFEKVGRSAAGSHNYNAALRRHEAEGFGAAEVTQDDYKVGYASPTPQEARRAGVRRIAAIAAGIAVVGAVCTGLYESGRPFCGELARHFETPEACAPYEPGYTPAPTEAPVNTPAPLSR